MGSKEVANIIKEIIDSLWAAEIDAEQATQKINEIMDDKEQRIKILRGVKKTAVFSRVMGIRRLSAFDELYGSNEKNSIDM